MRDVPRRMAWLTPLLAAGLLLVLTGCGGGSADSPAFTVKNDTRDTIAHLVITDAGPVLNYSKLGPGESQTRDMPNPQRYERPRQVSVFWEDADGRSQHQRIELWQHAPSTYTGGFTLTVERSGNVRVRKS